MTRSLKNETIKGVVWSGVEKLSTHMVTFIVNIIMARLLTPADYGIVGIIAVFVSFSQLFIDGGFTTALISKANRDEKDYRTVFVFNLSSSLLLYGGVYIMAPYIEYFYHLPQLGTIIRAYSLMLILSAFSAIQITRFTINVDFKTISKVNVPSSLLSGGFGVVLAYLGFGVWAIVGQQLLMALMRVLLLFYYSRWFPVFRFSFDRFKTLFSFSSNLVLSSLIDKIYSNSYPLFIGKFFPPAILGNYSRGHQFGAMPAGILGDIFNRVTFPLMSKIQNDNEQLVLLYRKFIKMSSFVIFPIMMMVVVISEPLVKLLLTDKWMGCVPFLQIISMALMLDHIGTINRNLLYVKQHSDWALKLEVIKKIIAISIFLISTFWGIWGVVVGQWFYGMLAPSLNAYYTYRLIGLELRKQIRDYIGLWFISVVSVVIPLWMVASIENIWIRLFLPLICYVIIYLIINSVIRTAAMEYFLIEIRSYKAKK